MSVLFLIATLFVAGSSETSNSRLLMKLDGFNEVVFDQEWPHTSHNMFSINYGSPRDRFPLNMVTLYTKANRDSCPTLAATGSLGAEVGDPLLNKYTGNSTYNRDHSSIMEMMYTSRMFPVRLYSGYRYVDSYSSRFDRIWSRQKMAFSELGLAKEIAGAYEYEGSQFEATGSGSRYGYWGTTPRFFSPIYRSGYKLFQEFRTEIDGKTLQANVGFDRKREYFERDTSVLFWDWDFALKYTQALNKDVEATVGWEAHTRLDPRSEIKASIYDTVSDPISWRIEGGVFRDFHVQGLIAATLAPTEHIAIDGQAEWDYIPRERDYTFLEDGRPVSYQHMEYERLLLHAAVRYKTRIRFPLNASVWYDYCNKPLWERIKEGEDTTFIYQDTLLDATRWSIGAKGGYDIEIRKTTIGIWGNCGTSPVGLVKKIANVFGGGDSLPNSPIRRFSLPAAIGVDVGYGKPVGDSLYAALRLESRAAATLAYADDDSPELFEYISPKYTGLSAVCRLPFLLPVFRDHIGVSFRVEAGPFYLDMERITNPDLNNQILAHHPFGAGLGPHFKIRIDGTLR